MVLKNLRIWTFKNLKVIIITKFLAIFKIPRVFESIYFTMIVFWVMKNKKLLLFRLTPVYVFVIFFSTYIHPVLYNGPGWTTGVDEQHCKDYWWTNILYINNFYPVSVLENVCLFSRLNFTFFILTTSLFLVSSFFP